MLTFWNSCGNDFWDCSSESFGELIFERISSGGDRTRVRPRRHFGGNRKDSTSRIISIPFVTLKAMTILFLHGWHSIVGGVKPTFLADRGHIVINPKLDNDDFEAALARAQQAFDRHRPDVVVGSSRGGAVAMNLDSGATPLVLLCPAWKRWGNVRIVKPGTVILHSRADDVIPFADSEELISRSGLPLSALVQVGEDHRLADADSLAAMAKACKFWAEPLA